MKDRGAAEAYVCRHGLTAEVLTAREVLGRRSDLFRRTRAQRLDHIIFHSVDWSRETAPQLPELAGMLLARARIDLADDVSAQPVRLPAVHRIAAVPRALADAARGCVCVHTEQRRVARLSRAPAPVPAGGPARASVMAIWLGGLSPAVGGSVTHMSGILSGFRQHGYRVTLLTNHDPPAQLQAVVDNIAVMPPLRRGHRLTADFERVAWNGAVREHGLRLSRTSPPGFIYQRHRPFLTAGLALAEYIGAPFVLEWNASEIWTRKHWESQDPVSKAFDALHAHAECAVVARSHVIAAVSTEAWKMALDSGAEKDRVIVVPNATDIDGIARASADSVPAGGDAPLIGWIGSFGPWHGAEVLVRALARLPTGFRARMIGDGSGRDACERLADELSIRDRVEFRKALPHDQAVHELAECDILASPHVPLPNRRFFGSPTKVFEYMALGRPIVASRLEQIGEILEDGVTARLVEPGDEHALAAALRDVWELPDRGERLGAEAVTTARSQHTWDERAAQILSALATVGSLDPATRPDEHRAPSLQV